MFSWGLFHTDRILQKIPTALKQAQATADASFQPELVWEGGAVPTGPGKFDKPAKRFEELDTDNGFAGIAVRYEFFSNLTDSVASNQCSRQGISRVLKNVEGILIWRAGASPAAS